MWSERVVSRSCIRTRIIDGGTSQFDGCVLVKAARLSAYHILTRGWRVMDFYNVSTYAASCPSTEIICFAREKALLTRLYSSIAAWGVIPQEEMDDIECG